MQEYVYRNRLVFYLVFALTLGVTIGLGYLSYRNFKAASETSQLEEHTYLIIIEFDKLLGSLTDAETGQRGYIITGDRRYLAPYQHALSVVDGNLADLRRLTKDDARQQRRVSAIEPAVHNKLSELDTTIKLRSAEGFAAARDKVATHLGKNIMDDLRGRVESAIRDEEQMLGDRAILEKKYSGQSVCLLLSGDIFGLAVLLTLYLFLWRAFDRRVRSEGELTENRVELEMQNEELRMARDEMETQNKDLSLSRDERLKTEALLGKYSDLYDFAPVGYLNLDRSGIIRAVNITGAGFLGVHRPSLIDRQLAPFLSEETRPIFSSFLQRVFASGAKETCEVVFMKERSEPIFAMVKAVISESVDECRAVIVDITERKRVETEKSKLENQLQQALKMESVGRLAGGVAHDFNNMLTVIIGHANIALADSNPAQPLHSHMEEILKAAERSANLTRQLLAFARKQTVTPKVLDLNATVGGMLKLLKRLIGEDIDLSWRPGENLWPIKIDPAQVDQILANLCVNARDSISDIGKITIETGNVVADECYCSHNSGFVRGDYVRIAVNDNGCGMDSETLAHIFEPFFTTKGVGEGSGLGLATVYGAAKQNNGFINVYSELYMGTTFTIYLPRFVGDVDHAPVEEVIAKRGQETILLVEDEPAILNITSMLLTKQGYTVLAANSPLEAIRLAGEHAGEVSLLMTDVVMPDMNGRDLAEKLLSQYPALKRLFMSGYTADIIAHHGVLDEGVHFIQKPFTMLDLAAKVRETLDAG